MSQYRIIYADPPWWHAGDPNKNAAAGKHYPLLKVEELSRLDVQSICKKPTVLFLWATCPRLPDALAVMKAWGFHFRGIPYIWIKTRQSDGKIIAGQGIKPTLVKPNAELVLGGTTNKQGRPLPLQTEAQGQIVLASRTRIHSEKPNEVRKRIEELCGDLPRVELFARQKSLGWDAWGNDITSDVEVQWKK